MEGERGVGLIPHSPSVTVHNGNQVEAPSSTPAGLGVLECAFATPPPAPHALRTCCHEEEEEAQQHVGGFG